MVAHVVQGLFVLTRSWVIVPLRLILGTHGCTTFGVVESGCVLGVVTWSWRIIFSLLSPDVLSLCPAYAHGRHLLSRWRVISVIISRSWVRVLLWLVLGAHIGTFRSGLTESIGITHVVARSWLITLTITKQLWALSGTDTD